MTEQTRTAARAIVTPATDAVNRIRTFNDKLIETRKTAGNAGIDAYEKAVATLVNIETKVAGATQSEWVSALAKTHTDLVTELSSSYTAAARALVS